MTAMLHLRQRLLLQSWPPWRVALVYWRWVLSPHRKRCPGLHLLLGWCQSVPQSGRSSCTEKSGWGQETPCWSQPGGRRRLPAADAAAAWQRVGNAPARQLLWAMLHACALAVRFRCMMGGEHHSFDIGNEQSYEV